MDETKEQSTDLQDLPDGDLDLDLADLDLDVPDLDDADPALPVFDDTPAVAADSGGDAPGGDLDLGQPEAHDMSFDDDLSFDDSGDAPAEFSADWEDPPDSGDAQGGDSAMAESPDSGVATEQEEPFEELAPQDDDEDLQPIALSEQELENILGDEDGGDLLGTPVGESEAPDALGVDFEEIDQEQTLGGTNDSLELTDADLTVDDTSEPAGAPDDVEHEELTPVDMDMDMDVDVDLDTALSSDELSAGLEEAPAAAGGDDDIGSLGSDSGHVGDFLADDDAPSADALDDLDEEPITLSEDELGSILDDVEPSEEVAEGVAPPPEFEPQPAAVASAPELDDSDAGIEEDITLSDEELNQVLLDGDFETDADQTLGTDAGDADDGMAAAAAGAGAAASLLDDDDDEPITLTAEELGNIVADADEESVAQPGVEVEEPIFETGEAPPSILDDDGDEGPVALSEHELDAILEDVDDSSPVDAPGIDMSDDDMLTAAPSLPPSEGDDEHVIVLDDYDDDVADDAPAPEEAPAAVAADRSESPVIDRAAAEGGLDRTELKKMITYLDGLFDQLPDTTVEEFSRSEYFELYKKIMSELGV